VREGIRTANLRQMLKQLEGERGRTHKELDSVDEAIAALEKLRN